MKLKSIVTNPIYIRRKYTRNPPKPPSPQQSDQRFQFPQVEMESSQICETPLSTFKEVHTHDNETKQLIYKYILRQFSGFGRLQKWSQDGDHYYFSIEFDKNDVEKAEITRICLELYDKGIIDDFDVKGTTLEEIFMKLATNEEYAGSDSLQS